MIKTIDPSEVRIRTNLLPGDLGYVAYLHGRLYAEESGYGFGFETYVMGGLYEFAKQYDPAKDRVWVCEHHQKIVGFLMGFHRDDALQLRYFLLLPEYRGLGLGKKLMGHFIVFMKERETMRAYLWTTNEQETAISLYTSHGFRLTEEKESNLFGKPLTERRYDLNLDD